MSTVWYRNTLQDTFHEVEVGTDTEKRMRGELHPVGDEGDESFDKTFEKVDAKAVPAAEDQVSYPPAHILEEHAAAKAAKAPKLTEADVDRLVQERIAALTEPAKPPAQSPAPPKK